MQGLLHCRGYDLADEHRCLLITIDDCAPEALPPGATLPAEWPKRKLVNFLKGGWGGVQACVGACSAVRPSRRPSWADLWRAHGLMAAPHSCCATPTSLHLPQALA